MLALGGIGDGLTRNVDTDPVRAVSSRLKIPSLLSISLFLIVVGNLGRVPFLDGGKKEAPLLLTDVVVTLVVIVGATAAMQNRRLKLDGPARMALVFAAVGALSAVLAVPRFGLTPFQFFFSIAYLIRWVVYFGIYLVVANLVTRADLERLWRALRLGILVFAVFGIIQSLFLPGFAQIVQPDAAWDRQGHRLVSTFLDPNFAGGFIMIGLLVSLARVSYGVKTSALSLIALVTALLLTLSRSSILATLIGGFVILAIRGLSRKLLLAGCALLVLMLPAVPSLIAFADSFGRFSTEGSAAQRFIVWLQALEMIRDHPIIGIGFNTYGYVQEYYNHSDALGGFHYFSLDGGLLFITVMTGGIGVAFYAWMLGSIIRRSRRLALSRALEPRERGLALGVAAVTVAMVVHSLFLNSLLFTLLMQPLWVLWGATSVLDRASSTGEGEAEADVSSSAAAEAPTPVLVALA